MSNLTASFRLTPQLSVRAKRHVLQKVQINYRWLALFVRSSPRWSCVSVRACYTGSRQCACLLDVCVSVCVRVRCVRP